MKKFLSSFLVILVMSVSTIGCVNLNRDYVKADIKKYTAVAPDLVEHYLEIEDPLERNIKMNSVKTWEIRIQEARKHPDLADLEFTPVPLPE